MEEITYSQGIILFTIFHSFFTSFIILNKSKVYDWLDNSYTASNTIPIYENNNFYIKDDNDDVLSLDQISALKMKHNGHIIWER